MWRNRGEHVSLQQILTFNIYQNHLEDLCKHRKPTARVSHSVNLECSWGICISGQFPGNGDSALWGSHFEKFTSIHTTVQRQQLVRKPLGP